MIDYDYSVIERQQKTKMNNIYINCFGISGFRFPPVQF